MCPVFFLMLIEYATHQGAACDAASVHFGPTVRRTDIRVTLTYAFVQIYKLTGKTPTSRSNMLWRTRNDTK